LSGLGGRLALAVGRTGAVSGICAAVRIKLTILSTRGMRIGRACNGPATTLMDLLRHESLAAVT
jgi:hypothetical protein